MWREGSSVLTSRAEADKAPLWLTNSKSEKCEGITIQTWPHTLR